MHMDSNIQIFAHIPVLSFPSALTKPASALRDVRSSSKLQFCKPQFRLSENLLGIKSRNLIFIQFPGHSDTQPGLEIVGPDRSQLRLQ